MNVTMRHELDAALNRSVLDGMQLEREALREYLRREMGHIPQARKMVWEFLNKREARVLTGHIRVSDTSCLCGCPSTQECSKL